MKILFVLFVLFALCSCKLTLKNKNIGRGVAEETALLKIEFRGSCADFALVAPSVTVNPIDYTAAGLTTPSGAPAAPVAGCLPFFLGANGVPTDYDNLNGHYVCTNVARDRAVIDVVEVFNNAPTAIVTFTANTEDWSGSVPDTTSTETSAAACQATCGAGCNAFAFDATPATSPNCFLFNTAPSNPSTTGTTTNGVKTTTAAATVNEHTVVPYILGITSNRPFRTLGATAQRRPTCALTSRLCTAATYDVRSCTTNTPTYKRGWILNKDLVYLVPNVYSANTPSDCRAGSTCCSYLPDSTTLNAAYIANTATAFCVAPTNTNLFTLEPRHDDHYGDKRSAQ